MDRHTDPTRPPESRASARKVDANGGERLHYANMEFAIRASAESTSGAFSIIEEIAPLDTPLHVHHHHDEIFYVLEGRSRLHSRWHRVRRRAGRPGVRSPRRAHAQRRLIPRTGRILAMFSPAGFEGFFRDLAEAARDGQVRPEEMNRIAAAYGLTWLV